MSILLRIQQTKNNFTETDHKIASYIENNLESITTTPTDILANKSNTSVAAWNRFAKRLGFKGITELKFEIIRTENDRHNIIDDWLIDQNDSLTTIAKKQLSMIHDALTTTEAIINDDTLSQCVSSLKTAKRIFVFGVGGNIIICQDFLQKLVRIGYTIIFQHDFHIMFLELNNCTKNDVLLTISYSGETQEVIFCAELAKEKGATIITLTNFYLNSTLAKLADLPLFIPKTENELRIGAIMSRNSMLYLTDLLYFGLILENFDGMREKIYETHFLANKFKKQ